jgi:hypothetical protein
MNEILLFRIYIGRCPRFRATSAIGRVSGACRKCRKSFGGMSEMSEISEILFGDVGNVGDDVGNVGSDVRNVGNDLGSRK